MILNFGSHGHFPPRSLKSQVHSKSDDDGLDRRIVAHNQSAMPICAGFVFLWAALGHVIGFPLMYVVPCT